MNPKIKEIVKNRRRIKALFGDGGETAKEKCREALIGKNIELRKNVRKYTDENPVYILSVDGDDFGGITLSQNEQSSFGFYTWKIEKAEIFTDFYNKFAYSVSITAPAGSAVEINGVPAGKDNIESEYIFNDKLSEFENFLTGKYYYLSYRFSGLTDEINIRVLLEDKELCIAGQSENRYFFEYPDDYAEDYEITVPTGSVLSVNGITVGEKYIKRRTVQPEKLSIFEKELGLTETVYLLPGLFVPPIIKAEYDNTELDIFDMFSEGNMIYFDIPEKMRYNLNIAIPENAVLKINGIDAPDEYLTVMKENDEKISGLFKFSGNVIIKSYSINNLYQNPHIDVFADAGNAVLYNKRENYEESNELYYAYKIEANSEKSAPVKDISERFIRDYIYYFAQGYTNIDANYAKVMEYVLSGAPVYSALKRSYDAVKWNSAYSTVYNELTINNIIYYNDNLFSGNVKFDVDMQRYGLSKNYSDTFEIFFVKYEGRWFVADIDFNFGDENK